MKRCPFCAEEIQDAAIKCRHCGSDLTVPRRNASGAPAATSQATSARVPGVICKVCDKGTLQRKRVHRMSPMVVIIGYILLIPSVLGMLFSVVVFVSVGSAGTTSVTKLRETVAARLHEASVPDPIIEEVLDGDPILSVELDRLTPSQRARVTSEQAGMRAALAGAGIGGALAGGFAFVMFIVALVGGLLGWLLIMKKDVLQCTDCNAVTAAS